MPRLPSYLHPIPTFIPDRPIVVTIQTIGVPAYIRALKSWDRNLQRAADKGVKKATEYLLKETLKVTPKKTGVLRDSGKTMFHKRGRETTGVVYFDDGEAPYAIYVHEDLTAYHKSPTIAKFLQVTQFKKRAKISQIIRDECAKARPR
jgi:hypothetical protein